MTANKPKTTRFRCTACGKLTAGRIPRGSWHPGDLSERWPRKHRIDGVVCEGTYLPAEWVEVEVEGDDSYADIG